MNYTEPKDWGDQAGAAFEAYVREIEQQAKQRQIAARSELSLRSEVYELIAILRDTTDSRQTQLRCMRVLQEMGSRP